MNILYSTLLNILSTCPTVPPETGGIIGETAGIVTHYMFDSGNCFSNGYDVYAPNVTLINRTITYWAHKKIRFCGIYHSHFPDGVDLSESDRRYIKRIMAAVPQERVSLFFPIVLPRKEMIAYRADRNGTQIRILRDKIKLY